jgi:hypothetical protein
LGGAPGGVVLSSNIFEGDRPTSDSFPTPFVALDLDPDQTNRNHSRIAYFSCSTLYDASAYIIIIHNMKIIMDWSTITDSIPHFAQNPFIRPILFKNANQQFILCLDRLFDRDFASHNNELKLKR